MPQRPTTILQIIPELDAGGAEQSVVEIVAALTKAGARALVAAEPGGRLAPDVSAAGGEVIAFPAATKNPLRMLANARALRQLVASERVDLIHARSRAPAWSALLAARRAGVPFVTTYHGAYNEPHALKRGYNSVMAKGDVVIANSHYTAALIEARYHTEPERLAVVHRGVDATLFDRGNVEPDRIAALQRSWDMAPGQPVILHAARLTRWKGQSVLIDAVARLRSRGALRNAVLVLAGDAQGRDGYVAELRAQALRLGIGTHIRFAGHIRDMPAAFSAATVAVLASIEPEAFGRTAIEAAAVGCPVIATNIGAPAETVLAHPAVRSNKTTGWLVPPGDTEALAAALAQALTLQPQELATISRNARAHVLDAFTTHAMQRRTLSVYDRLLGTTLEREFGSRTPG